LLGFCLEFCLKFARRSPRREQAADVVDRGADHAGEQPAAEQPEHDRVVDPRDRVPVEMNVAAGHCRVLEPTSVAAVTPRCVPQSSDPNGSAQPIRRHGARRQISVAGVAWLFHTCWLGFCPAWPLARAAAFGYIKTPSTR